MRQRSRRRGRGLRLRPREGVSLLQQVLMQVQGFPKKSARLINFQIFFLCDEILYPKKHRTFFYNPPFLGPEIEESKKFRLFKCCIFKLSFKPSSFPSHSLHWFSRWCYFPSCLIKALKTLAALHCCTSLHSLDNFVEILSKILDLSLKV